MKKLIQPFSILSFCFSFHHTAHRTPPKDYVEQREELRSELYFYQKFLEDLIQDE